MDTSTGRLLQNSHIPHRQRNWSVPRPAIFHDRRSYDQDGKLLGLFQILRILAPSPLPVVLREFVTVRKTVVELGIIGESCLGDSRYIVEVCLGGSAQYELVGAICDEGTGVVPHGVDYDDLENKTRWASNFADDKPCLMMGEAATGTYAQLAVNGKRDTGC